MWNMCSEAQQGWANEASDVRFWKASGGKLGFRGNTWDNLTPWWHNAWVEWLRLGWTPKQNSVDLQQLKRWPVWNNRILAENHGMHSTLRRSANANSTPENYRRFRALGFLTFDDFIDSTNNVLQPIALYNRVKQRIDCAPVTFTDMSKRACTAMSNRVSTMWIAAKNKWLADTNTHDSEQHEEGTATWTDDRGRTLKTASNSYIASRITQRTSHPDTTSPPLIKIDSHQITIDWKRERSCLMHLAPTRGDLLFRIVRNALPLGFKRHAWEGEYQTVCPNCNDNRLETAAHLFWECPFAITVWRDFINPWRGASNTQVVWKDAVIGTDMHIQGNKHKVYDQLWAVIRSCILRVLWLERNHRIFNQQSTPSTPNARTNQASSDIRAHYESILRRASANDKIIAKNCISYLVQSNSRYHHYLTAHTTHGQHY